MTIRITNKVIDFTTERMNLGQVHDLSYKQIILRYHMQSDVHGKQMQEFNDLLRAKVPFLGMNSVHLMFPDYDTIEAKFKIKMPHPKHLENYSSLDDFFIK